MEEQIINQTQQVAQELPKDLSLICNNEQGKYSLFGSRKEGQVFAVFKITDDTMGDSMVIKELLPSTIHIK